MATLYSYVGPPEIAAAANAHTDRRLITNADDARRWLSEAGESSNTVTFVVDARGDLWIADRRSEHIACARGGPVRSAGEMTLEVNGNEVTAAYVTNQSTGYCPEPRSWDAVAEALDRAGIERAGGFDVACEFRRCVCGQINIVKNGVFECAVCGAELPHDWNLDSGTR